MENKWQKVFVACALGAFIGSVVALQLNNYFWWIGLIAGGLVGYITYEFDVVLRAIPKAWKEVVEWRPDVEYWRALGKISVYLTLFASVVTVPLSMLFLLTTEGGIYNTVALFLMTTLPTGLMIAWVDIGTYNREKYQSVVQESRKLAQYNALTIPFWHLPKLILKTGWLIVSHVPAGVVLLFHFLWKVFKLIHSDKRLLCGVDAAIGAAVGYFTGNALIGALSGGILGVANFEIVSKRLLNLVPAKHA